MLLLTKRVVRKREDSGEDAILARNKTDIEGAYTRTVGEAEGGGKGEPPHPLPIGSRAFNLSHRE